MRLLNVYDFKFEHFFEPDIPPYIIASHRWTDEEISLKDFQKSRNADYKGYQKVKGFCRFVRTRLPTIKWLWIDTVCIDQRWSAEVSEAINSMFVWYRQAVWCVAYLADTFSWDIDNGYRRVEHSGWFERGWTLQELVAPKAVMFFSSDWDILGYKHDADVARGIVRKILYPTFTSSRKIS